MYTIIYKDFISSRTYFYSYAAIRTVSLYHLIKGNLHMGHFLFLFTTHWDFIFKKKKKKLKYKASFEILV